MQLQVCTWARCTHRGCSTADAVTKCPATWVGGLCRCRMTSAPVLPLPWFNRLCFMVFGVLIIALPAVLSRVQRDDDLWEPLIALTLGDAQLTGGLDSGPVWHASHQCSLQLLWCTAVGRQPRAAFFLRGSADGEHALRPGSATHAGCCRFPWPAGELLDHAGGYIDPLRVVSQIPKHMQASLLYL